MSAYIVSVGDTWESISRKTYGVETGAARIQRANPGASEPLSAGTLIFTPLEIGADVPPTPQRETVNPNETSVTIDGARFKFWEGIAITRSLDSVDTASFTTSSDMANDKFSEAFKPFSFAPITVVTGGAPIFMGTMMRPTPSVNESEARIGMDCYGTPGVLQDCTAPSSSFPVEFNDMTLLEISTSLCDPFGIEVQTSEDVGAPFDRVALTPQTKVFTFLADLAVQRNLVLGDSSTGALVLRRAVNPGKPVAVLSEGEKPLTAITGSFDPQKYYSHITGLREALIGSDGEQYTIQNKRLPGVLRPFVFQASDTEEGNLQTAVENKAGLMVGNAVTYSLSVAGWRTPSGVLWEPNTTVKVTAPRANITTAYEFLIRSVEYRRDGDSESCTLGLVLPGSFSGKMPEVLPWD